MKECNKSTRKTHKSINFILSISLLIMIDTFVEVARCRYCQWCNGWREIVCIWMGWTVWWEGPRKCFSNGFQIQYETFYGNEELCIIIHM